MNIYDLKQTLQRRTNKLALRAAAKGIDVNPDITMELEDLQKVLKQIDVVVKNKQVSSRPETMAPLEERLRQLLVTGTLSIVVYQFDYTPEGGA